MRKGFLMRGYSIVELVVIIVVVAILAVTAMPRFFAIFVFQDRAFYEEAIASMRYAQKLAVATHCPVRVEFTAAGYSLYRPANNGLCDTGPYNTAVTDPSNLQAVYARSAPGGVTPTAANFSFTAGGTTAADVVIVIGDHSFRVHAATGFVQELGN